MFDFCRDLVVRGQQFDVVGILGVFYHIMSHYELLALARRLEAKLIIIDASFLRAKRPLIIIKVERTESRLNALSSVEGQEQTPIGVVSIPALEVMAKSLGYSAYPVDWTDSREHATCCSQLLP